MAFVLWKDKDALHKAHQKGVCFGIVAKKFGTPINWVTFAKETNTSQHSKFFKWLENMELKSLKVMHGKWELHLEGESTVKAIKFEITETLCVVE
jgi:hypothetical protein